VDWTRGYYAEGGYTYGFYAETAPARLQWLALLQGFSAPSKNFRYLDLGCGQGLSLIHMAALHPDSEFVGIDFMPEHVAHGRQLAAAAALPNVSFIEGDFIELANDARSLGDFDYAVAHGISTWISPTVREAMFSLAGKALKPGGLMYNSYNVYPGWLPASPFQNLVLQLQSRYGGRQALQIAQKTMTDLNEAGSGLFKLLPSLESRLEGMQKQDVAYLLQEYNNHFWQPVYSSQMLTDAKAHKLEFMSSATLLEVFDGCYPKAVLSLIAAESDPILKETIRDLSLIQSFRRDVYIKGGVRIFEVDKVQAILDQRFIVTGLVNLPDTNKGFDFKGGSINRNGKIDVYKPLLEAFGEKGNSLREVIKNSKGLSLPAITESVSLLVHGGWLGFEGASNNASATALNRVTTSTILRGSPYRYLCCPKIETSFLVGELDLMCIGLMNEDKQSTELAERLLRAMKIKKMHFIHDDKPVNDERQSRQRAVAFIKEFMKDRHPNYKRLGAVIE